MDEVEKLFAESGSAAAFTRDYLSHTAEILAEVDEASVCAFIEALLEARDQRRTIYLCGNGGSAATASHFANDLAVGVRTSRPFRAVSLCSNPSVLTAIGNDFGFEQVFARQLKGRIEPGDLLVVISASGRSENLVQALATAREHGAVTVGLTGFDGGEVRRQVAISLHVPTSLGEYGPVEAVHTVLLHIVSNYLMLRCR